MAEVRKTKETDEFLFTPAGEPDQVWVLSKASGESYRVDLKDFVCSCADFKFRHAKGDRLCKHLAAAAEAYDIKPEPGALVPTGEHPPALTFSQEQMMDEISHELRDEMVQAYVYAVPDYERGGRKKRGWIDLRATGIRDLAHMLADRYGQIELGEFRFMDAGSKWVAWRDIRLGNFVATGFADCDKEREFPYRYLGTAVMRNAYKAIVPRIFQDLFTDKFRQLMRQQLGELLGANAEQKLGKPIGSLTDGELARALEDARQRTEPQGKKAPPGPALEEPPGLFAEEGAPATKDTPHEEQGVVKRDHTLINNQNMFYSACFEDFKLQPREALKMAGYASPTDVLSWPMAYLNVAGSMGARVVMPST